MRRYTNPYNEKSRQAKIQICNFATLLFRMRYFLEIAYDGKEYAGWQRQPNAITVQEVIEDRLSKLFGQTVAITGAGRTDAGVHAKQLFAHFDVDFVEDLENLKYRLNSFLPTDIAINSIIPVQENAHARFEA